MSTTTAGSPPANPLDQYEALDVIGNGSFGIIRKVRRKSDGEILARKELNFEKMTERDRKQIVAEVNILKDLHHENIVRYIDRFVDREAGILYILMEYCDGGDLSSVIKQCARNGRLLPEDTIWSYFFQLLQALQHCHCPNTNAKSCESGDTSKRQQILHRDLKPENVFLNSNNTIKLGDFGLSKALGQTCFANTYVGTPYYMSPELIQEKAYDTKSDIWSLGCLIYELCALKPPFHEAQTHSELSMLIRNGRIPPLPKGYSHSLSQLIKAMLNLNPSMRPSAQQLLQHERLEFSRKVSETEKLLTAVKAHKTNLSTKEKELQALSESLAQREAMMTTVIQQKDQEIQNLTLLLSQSEDRVREAVAAREAELRDLVLLREEQVKLELLRRDEEIRAAIHRRQEEINSSWQVKEDALRKELEGTMQWVERRQKELQDEAAALENAKAAFEAAQQSSGKGRREKMPFEEVKNLLVPSPDYPQTFGLTPKKSFFEDAIAAATLETPAVTKQENVPHIPGSAMKGIVLTSTGETLQTPMPFSRIGSNDLEVGKIMKQSPAVGLNFRKIFDFEEEDSEDDDDEVDNDSTGRQSSSGSSGEDTVALKTETVNTEADGVPTSPTVDAEKKKSIRASTSLKGSRARSRSIDPSRPPSAGGITPSTSTQAAPTRLRRPSIRTAGRARTHLPQSSSYPTALPDVALLKDTPTRPQSVSIPTRTSSTGIANTAAKHSAGTPRYNAEDEENLPSPFLRRIERERLTTANPRVAATATAVGANTGVSGRRKSNGNMLRAIAAANSANNHGTTTSSATTSSMTAVSVVGAKAS